MPRPFVGVNICGRIFGPKPVNLELFSSKPFEHKQQGKGPQQVQWSVIFGKNGCGKSTLAHSFYLYSSLSSNIQKYNSDVQLNFIDSSGSRIEKAISPDNCFVFGDDFVHDKIHYGEDNLGAIAMINTNNDLSERLEEINEKITKYSKEFEELNTHYQETTDDEACGDKISARQEALNYLLKCFRKSSLELQNNPGSWAEIIGITLNQNKQATKINEDSLKRQYKNYIKNNALVKESESLKPRFQSLDENLTLFLKDYQSSVKGIKPIQIELDDPESLSKKLTEVQRILKSQTNTDMSDDIIITHLKDPKIGVNVQQTEDFLAQKPSICKLCLQQIPESHRQKILNVLKKIEKDEKNHELQKDCKNCKIELNEFINKLKQNVENLDDCIRLLFNTEGKKKESEIEAKYNIFYEAIEDTINELTRKSNELGWTPKYQTSQKTLAAYTAYYNAIAQVNNRINDYNNRLTQLEKRKASLKDEVTLLSYSRYYPEWKNYESIEKDCAEGTQQLKTLYERLEGAKQEQANLKSQMNGYSLALDYINSSLELIFLDPHRLRLENDSDNPREYRILVRDKHVKLSQLSEGEKKAINLSVFFASIYEGKTDDFKFSDNFLIILDDPIDSMDFTNETGLLALIAKNCKDLMNVHTTNPSNFQCLTLTHNISVFYEFYTIGSSTGGLFAKPKQNKKARYYSLKFAKEKGTPVCRQTDPSRLRPVYIELLDEIYCSISSIKPNSDIHSLPFSGNDLRRAIEEYSSFNFNKGATLLTRDQVLLNRIDNKKLASLIEDTRFHFWLNGESHGAKSAKTGGPHITTPIDIDAEVKQAKLLFLFIDAIHPTGLIGLIVRENDNNAQAKKAQIKTDLETWKVELTQMTQKEL